MNLLLFRISAVLCFLGVALGAFGAHGLKTLLATNGTLDIWNKAVFYHLVHAVALVALSWHPTENRGALTCLFLGILIFSGSLYLLAITNAKWLGAITPIGGLFFLIGWAWLAFSPAR
jgi:uncharacterized membrane protein YgdD (TMEM256/DUF423 family)